MERRGFIKGLIAGAIAPSIPSPPIPAGAKILLANKEKVRELWEDSVTRMQAEEDLWKKYDPAYMNKRYVASGDEDEFIRETFMQKL